ncbi:MAG: dockerin type I domain-containing protein, partial [Defluviitaleaceae bacterium]|nr:dockerin type I domain-containing protein [Defluviitaleaceae bacterium]
MAKRFLALALAAVLTLTVGVTFRPVTAQAAPAPLPVTAMSVTAQPQLAYAELDTLDLSAIQVTLTYSDDSTAIIGFADFAANRITTAYSNGWLATSGSDALTMAQFNGLSVVLVCGLVTTGTDALTITPNASFDVNGDGKVDSADLALIMANLNKKASTNATTKKCDVNASGVVDLADYALVSNYISSLNAAATLPMAPEPAALTNALQAFAADNGSVSVLVNGEEVSGSPLDTVGGNTALDATVTDGDPVQVTASPAAGYVFSEWTVTDADGGAIDLTGVAGLEDLTQAALSFDMPAADLSFTPSFEKAPKTVATVTIKTIPSSVTLDAGKSGVINPAGGVITVAYTDPVTYPNIDVPMTDAGVACGTADTSKVGWQTVAVTYGGVSADLYVVVEPGGTVKALTFNADTQTVADEGAWPLTWVKLPDGNGVLKSNYKGGGNGATQQKIGLQNAYTMAQLQTAQHV